MICQTLVELPDGFCLNAYFDEGEWSVWLDTDVSNRDGICLAVGPVKSSVLVEAQQVLAKSATGLRLTLEAVAAVEKEGQ